MNVSKYMKPGNVYALYLDRRYQCRLFRLDDYGSVKFHDCGFFGLGDGERWNDAFTNNSEEDHSHWFNLSVPEAFGVGDFVKIGSWRGEVTRDKVLKWVSSAKKWLK